jgi:hypothetical protein
VILMTSPNFSPRLTAFLNKIEKETGKNIKILQSPDLGLAGISAAYRYHPDYIVIVITVGIKRTEVDLERSIAHEAVHGYLMHKKKFCRPVFNEKADNNYQRDVQLLFTMVDDIAVNKIIGENGFHPFGSEYLPMVAMETEVAAGGEIKGEDFYRKFSGDPQLEAILMVSRYLLAWGFLEYFPLEPGEQEVISSFTISFETYYPHYYRRACKIRDIILENDIFTAKGQCKAVQKILDLWGLGELVEMEKG